MLRQSSALMLRSRPREHRHKPVVLHRRLRTAARAL